MRFIVRVVIVAAAATGPLGCARYEWVPDYELPRCAASHRPTSGPPLTFEHDSGGSSNTLRGRVVLPSGSRGIPGTSVTLFAEPARATTTDSLGTFAFVDVPAGTHVLGTRRIGYRSRTDTLRLPLTRGAALVLPLETEMLDGPCSGFAALRVRKPWWKLW